MQEKILPRKFYAKDPAIVAQKLLGAYLVHKVSKKLTLIGKIVETEAYLHKDDLASHSFKGETKRNKSMFKDAGHAYVYTLRQYSLVNVVTDRIGIAGAVLIRAIEPVQGIEVMKKLRKTEEFNIGNGPGKLCQAMMINMSLDGIDITVKNSPLYIVKGKESVKAKNIGISSRIGISKSQDLQLRFWIKENEHVSKHPKLTRKKGANNI